MPKVLVKGLIAVVDRWVPLFSTPKSEFLGLAIMAPMLVVLVAWLGIALGLPVVLVQVVAMIQGLVCAFLYTVKSMLYSIRTEIADTRSTAQMNPAEGVGEFSETPDSSE